MYNHDVEQRFSQIWGATFRSLIAARAIVSRSARCRVNACKGDKRLLALEAAHITDLRHELWPERFPNAVHFHNDRVFRELGSQLVHLAAVDFHAARDCRELVGGFLNKRFRDGGFLHQHDSGLCQSVHLSGLFRAELAAVSLAPLAVALGKSVLAPAADAIDMPEVVGKIVCRRCARGCQTACECRGKTAPEVQ